MLSLSLNLLTILLLIGFLLSRRTGCWFHKWFYFHDFLRQCKKCKRWQALTLCRDIWSWEDDDGQEV